MQTVTIYGASDDLVEVVGDVPGCNEYGAYDSPRFVEFSNGMAFRVEYTDAGVWKVTQVQYGGSATDGTVIRKEPHGEGDDPEPYTDTVTVTGNFEWVEVWKSLRPTPAEKADKVSEILLRGEPFDAVQLTEQDINDLLAVALRVKRRA